MTLFLTVEDVIAIHDREKQCALLDRGRLEAAVAQPSMGLADGYLYPTVFLQAAVLLHRICQAHAFEDANKRTAWLSCVTFLALNGVVIRENLDSQVPVGWMVAVATGRLQQEDIAKLLERVAVLSQ